MELEIHIQSEIKLELKYTFLWNLKFDVGIVITSFIVLVVLNVISFMNILIFVSVGNVK